MTLPRMRTIKQCAEYFKSEDPETTVNEYFLRTLVKSGNLKVVKAGNKSLISLDKLIEYLNGQDEEEQEEQQKQPEGYGKIRRVEL